MEWIGGGGGGGGGHNLTSTAILLCSKFFPNGRHGRGGGWKLS